jgi:hypothetical protein
LVIDIPFIFGGKVAPISRLSWLGAVGILFLMADYWILMSCDLFIFIKLSMSFQGIRKIREAKRGTPILLENN